MKLSPEIIIDVSPENFQFICEDQQLTLDACVCLTYDENGKYQFVAIGERSDIAESVFVRLFENQPLDPSIERFDLITGFMEYGIGRVLGKSWHPIRKPVVIVRGAESFRTYFSGYHKFFLEAIALAGGARDIRFE